MRACRSIRVANLFGDRFATDSAVGERIFEPRRKLRSKIGLRLARAEKMGISGAANPPAQFSSFSRIRDFGAKCGDFGAEKFRNWREKDSLAERGGF